MSTTALVIDDSATARDLLRSLFERERVFDTILEARNGAEALRIMSENRPSLAVCDLEMPDFDGRWLLKTRASVDQLREIPVIMIAGSNDLATRAEILDLGASDFVSKPFHEKELLARIRIQLRLRALQDELRSSNARLEALANTDALTGLFNRRHLEVVLAREVTRAER